jgi:hypothetical protein
MTGYPEQFDNGARSGMCWLSASHPGPIDAFASFKEHIERAVRREFVKATPARPIIWPTLRAWWVGQTFTVAAEVANG